MTPEERETPGYFSFTSGSSIIDFMKAYAAHDMWAKRKIQAWMKSRLGGILFTFIFTLLVLRLYHPT